MGSVGLRFALPNLRACCVGCENAEGVCAPVSGATKGEAYRTTRPRAQRKNGAHPTWLLRSPRREKISQARRSICV